MKDNHDELMELIKDLEAKFSVLNPKDEAMVISTLRQLLGQLKTKIQQMDYDGELD